MTTHEMTDKKKKLRNDEVSTTESHGTGVGTADESHGTGTEESHGTGASSE